MRYHAVRPPLKRMMAIDQTIRSRKWPTDRSLARELEELQPCAREKSTRPRTPP